MISTIQPAVGLFYYSLSQDRTEVIFDTEPNSFLERSSVNPQRQFPATSVEIYGKRYSAEVRLRKTRGWLTPPTPQRWWEIIEVASFERPAPPVTSPTRNNNLTINACIGRAVREAWERRTEQQASANPLLTEAQKRLDCQQEQLMKLKEWVQDWEKEIAKTQKEISDAQAELPTCYQ